MISKKNILLITVVSIAAFAIAFYYGSWNNLKQPAKHLIIESSNTSNNNQELSILADSNNSTNSFVSNKNETTGSSTNIGSKNSSNNLAEPGLSHLPDFHATKNSFKVIKNDKQEEIIYYYMALINSIGRGDFDASIKAADELIRLNAPVEFMEAIFKISPMISEESDDNRFNTFFKRIKSIVAIYPNNPAVMQSFYDLTYYYIYYFFYDKDNLEYSIETFSNFKKNGFIVENNYPYEVTYIWSNLHYGDPKYLADFLDKLNDNELAYSVYKNTFNKALENVDIDKAKIYLNYLNPTDKPFLEAKLLIETGDSEKAKDILTSLIESKKHLDVNVRTLLGGTIWLYLGTAYENIYDYNKAIFYYKKSFSTSKEDYDYDEYYLLPKITFLYLYLNKPQEAFNYLAEIIESINKTGYNYAFEYPFLKTIKVFAEFGQFDYADKLIKKLDTKSDSFRNLATFSSAMVNYSRNNDIEKYIKTINSLDKKELLSLMNYQEYINSYIFSVIKEKKYDEAISIINKYEDSNIILDILSLYCLTKKGDTKKFERLEKELKETKDISRLDLLYSTFANFDDLLNGEGSSSKNMEELIKLDPTNYHGLNYIGYNLANKGIELERAESLLTEAVSISRNNPYILDSLAWAKYKLGKNEEAFKIINDCIKYGVTEPLIWEHYGDIAVSLNKFKEAKDAYNRALKLPNNNTSKIKQNLSKISR